MSSLIEDKALKSTPPVNTILIVEDFLKNMDESIITEEKLHRRLSSHLNRSALSKILRYMEENNKIAVSAKGITWIFTTNKNLRDDINKGLNCENNSKTKRF